MFGFLKRRLKQIEKAAEQSKPGIYRITYKNGKTEEVIEKGCNLMDICLKPTKETGIVSVVRINGDTADDNFYNAMLTEDGLLTFEDDSGMLGDQEE